MALRPWWSLRQLLGCGLLLVLLQVMPAARDEAQLKSRLTESLVIVNQARAIQQLANKLSDDLGRDSVRLALIGAQARTAARAVLEVLTDGRGCLQWNAAQPVEPGAWVTSPTNVRAAVAQVSDAVGAGVEVVVVIEHMEKLDCGNLLHLNNLMRAMEPDQALQYPSGTVPTFLFLFEEDPPRRALVDGGIRSHLVEALESRCHPGPALTLRAFFGRLQPVTLEPVPADAAPDTQPLCSSLPRGRDRGLWGLSWPFGKQGGLSLTSKLLAVAAVGLGTYALVRAAAAAARQREAAERTPIAPTPGATALSKKGAGKPDECMTGAEAVETLTTSVRGGKAKAKPTQATRRPSAAAAAHANVAGTDEGAGAKGTNGGVKAKKTGAKRAASPKPTGRRTPR